MLQSPVCPPPHLGKSPQFSRFLIMTPPLKGWKGIQYVLLNCLTQVEENIGIQNRNGLIQNIKK